MDFYYSTCFCLFFFCQEQIQFYGTFCTILKRVVNPDAVDDIYKNIYN
jgi:hypothetical protein